MACQNKKFITGFTLIELLVVIGIIALLASLAVVSLGSVTKKGRDSKRKSDLAQIGKFLSLGCFLPDSGGGEYDLIDIVNEAKTKNPQYANFFANPPKDPKIGTAAKSYYYYKVETDGKKCALYANLENGQEKITLTGLTSPTPGAGSGVLQAAAIGWNGSNKYFQFSN